MASIKLPQVRPEYGPTLPELIAPLPRRLRIALAIAAVAVAVIAAGLLVTAGEEEHEVLVREPITFNLIYGAGLERTEVPGTLLALQRRADGTLTDSYVVRELRLPAYRGAPAGILPIFAVDYVKTQRRRYDSMQLELEGRARVNNGLGYQLLFRAQRDGRSLYVRHLLLVPEEQDGVRDGVIIELESTFGSTPNLAAVGTYTPLKTPYRSFRFGADREGGEA